MLVLVTLKQAKAHLKLPLDVTADDKDLQLKLDAAHDLVGDYLEQRRDTDDGLTWALQVEAWDKDTAPPRVIQAVCILFGVLARYRGDDEDQAKADLGELPRPVTALLYRLRDPAIA